MYIPLDEYAKFRYTLHAGLRRVHWSFKERRAGYVRWPFEDEVGVGYFKREMLVWGEIVSILGFGFAVCVCFPRDHATDSVIQKWCPALIGSQNIGRFCADSFITNLRG